MEFEWEAILNIGVDSEEVKQVMAQIMTTSAKMRIHQGELERIHKFVPADLKWDPRGGGDRGEIYEKMISDRGGNKATPLRDSGLSGLVGSLQPVVFENWIGVSSHLPYAQVHQTGGVSPITKDQTDVWSEKYNVTFKEGQSVNVYPRRYVRWEEKEQIDLMTWVNKNI